MIEIAHQVFLTPRLSLAFHLIIIAVDCLSHPTVASSFPPDRTVLIDSLALHVLQSLRKQQSTVIIIGYSTMNSVELL